MLSVKFMAFKIGVIIPNDSTIQVTNAGTLRLPFRYRTQPIGRTHTNTLGQIVTSMDL